MEASGIFPKHFSFKIIPFKKLIILYIYLLSVNPYSFNNITMDESKQREELTKKLQSRVANRIATQRTPLKLNPLDYGSSSGSATGKCNFIIVYHIVSHFF